MSSNINEEEPTLDDSGSSGVANETRIAQLNTSVIAPSPPTPALSSEYLRAKGVDLGGFLSRPVQIYHVVWSEGTSLRYNIDPWAKLLRYPSIRNKLTGYSRFRASLKMKILVNASPFQYAPLQISYKPLSGPIASDAILATEADDFSGGFIDVDVDDANYQGLLRSSRNALVLNPATTVEAEMSVPFVWPFPWYNLDVIVDPDETPVPETGLGRLTFYSLSRLQSVSGTASTPAQITVMAWFEDVEVQGPSVKIQSGGGEYVNRPVSATSSVITGVSRMLSLIPSIRPMALATEMVSSGVGALASRFGYSAVPVIEESHPYFPAALPALATSDRGAPNDILALDAKNEISVDPMLAASKNDDMLLRNILSKKILIGEIQWDSTDLYPVVTGTVVVTPEAYRAIPDTVGPSSSTPCERIAMSPSCHIAQAFRYWSGTIDYTFTVVATKFHRGRLRIMYDPNGPNLYGATEPRDEAILMNTILDVSESPSVTLSIPMMGTRPWLECNHRSTNFNTLAEAEGAVSSSATPTMPYTISDQRFYNGVIYLQVINELSQPTASSDVRVLVEMDCSRVRFACPTEIDSTLNSGGSNLDFTPGQVIIQSSSNTGVQSVTDQIGESEEWPEDAALYMGEVIPSIRNLIQRTSLFYYDAKNLDKQECHIIDLPRMPITRGFRLPNSYLNLVDKSTTPTVTEYFNAVNVIPLTWFASCYAGLRGGVNWRHSPMFGHCMITTRRFTRSMTTMDSATSSTLTTDIMGAYGSCAAGAVANCSQANPVTGARVVSYSSALFTPGNPMAYPGGVGPGGGTIGIGDSANAEKTDGTVRFITYQPNVSVRASASFLWVSAGHDFSMLHYINPPSITIMSASINQVA
jgi:hypothetical protein